MSTPHAFPATADDIFAAIAELVASVDALEAWAEDCIARLNAEADPDTKH